MTKAQLDYDFAVTYDVWLIFKPGEGYWMNKFLKTGFGHVLMLSRDEYNWIYHDPHRLRMTYGIPPYQVTDDLPHLLVEEGFTVIKIRFFDRSTMRKLRHSWLHNCVAFIKYALGIQVRCLTPYGLYRKLLGLNKKQKFVNGIISVEQIS